MRGIINFIQEILMIKKQDKIFIGLSQFKYSQAPVIEEDKTSIKKSEIKLSDLMRRTVWKDKKNLDKKR